MLIGMTNCSEVQHLLGAYLARTASPRERKQIQAHLAVCPQCQAELDSLAKLHGSLRSSLRKSAAFRQADPHLRERVRRKVSQSWRGGTTESAYRRMLATGEPGERPGSLGWVRAVFSAGWAAVGRAFTGVHWARLRQSLRATWDRLRRLARG
jgi:anti-sigma factor RsiW